jgi:hypothetical protein
VPRSSDSGHARRKYRTPRLREFGPVSVLTQAGTGAMIENVSMNGMGNPNRRP